MSAHRDVSEHFCPIGDEITSALTFGFFFAFCRLFRLSHKIFFTFKSAIQFLTMKTQSQILTLFNLHQANAFLSNVAKRSPTCLNFSCMSGMDTRRQSDAYRKGSPDMGRLY